MQSLLLISPHQESIVTQINNLLSENQLNKNHPDVFYLTEEDKSGIEQVRKIKSHLATKPFQAKVKMVVIEDCFNLSLDAQNALLKSLEEPPANSLIILGAKSEANLLPTILSRCQIIQLKPGKGYVVNQEELLSKYKDDFQKLLSSSVEERFLYIADLTDREQFLNFLAIQFRQLLLEASTKNSPKSETTGQITNFIQQLLQAEAQAAQNVNIRAILEYLMLVMPQKK